MLSIFSQTISAFPSAFRHKCFSKETILERMGGYEKSIDSCTLNSIFNYKIKQFIHLQLRLQRIPAPPWSGST